MKSNLRTVLQWLGIAGAVVTIGAGFTKSYFTTPMILDEHGREIAAMKRSSEVTTIEIRYLRDLILEIRGDIKVLNKNNPRREDQ